MKPVACFDRQVGELCARHPPACLKRAADRNNVSVGRAAGGFVHGTVPARCPAAAVSARGSGAEENSEDTAGAMQSTSGGGT